MHCNRISTFLNTKSFAIFVIAPCLICHVSTINVSNVTNLTAPIANFNLTAMMERIRQRELQSTQRYTRRMLTSWAYATNMTDFNKDQLTALQMEMSQSGQDRERNSSMLRLYQISTEMQEIYTAGSPTYRPVIPITTGMDPRTHIVSLFRRLWKSRRDAIGRKIRPLYPEFIQLMNRQYRTYGVEDIGAFWRGDYGDLSFRHNLATLYTQLAPLYKELHAYLRYKLKRVYGTERFPQSGHIPAELLSEVAIGNYVKPYDKETVDISDIMRQQGLATKERRNGLTKAFIEVLTDCGRG